MGDQFEIVLDHHQRVALGDQPAEHAQQSRISDELSPVVGSSSRNIRGSVLPLSRGRQRFEVGEQKARELEPLRLAARERRGRLAESQITEADRSSALRAVASRCRDACAKKPRASSIVSVEHFVDVAALIADREDVALEAAAVTSFALHFEIGHEMHLDRHRAGAVASFASSAVDVEGKIARLDRRAAAPPAVARTACGFRRRFSDKSRDSSAAIAPAFLPHVDHLADLLEPLDPLARAHVADRLAARRR